MRCQWWRNTHVIRVVWGNFSPLLDTNAVYLSRCVQVPLRGEPFFRSNKGSPENFLPNQLKYKFNEESLWTLRFL